MCKTAAVRASHCARILQGFSSDFLTLRTLACDYTFVQ